MITLPPNPSSPSSLSLGKGPSDSTEKKIKVLTLGDHPLAPSGVGIQTRNICEALLQSGKFTITSLGGAIKHQSYDPIKTEDYKDDWVIYPVDGYGNANILRSLITYEKPDIVWFMTDPRFWGWLWAIDNEVRASAPFVYYHVWDNYPYPFYNKNFYESNDHIVTISKVTDDIVRNVAPAVSCTYLPHAVDGEVFKKGVYTKEEVSDFKQKHSFGDKMLFFWNSRNARRKQSGSLLFWFKDFLDEVGHDKAVLLMHTNTKDPNGQDLDAIVEELELTNGQVFFSRDAVDPNQLALIYNMADCTLCVSDAEGFGLSTLESLACGTPIITTMTGGPQEQATDGDNWFGIGIEPASKAIIGSQEVPYIYEDRVSGTDVKNALITMYNMSPKERETMGDLGREHVAKNYNFEDFKKNWVDLMLEIHETNGSHDTRKGYDKWQLLEVA
tara:strand:+ start:280 stop:1608 length:1329 start_codon:yes stop_codon:yes gene_type:complete